MKKTFITIILGLLAPMLLIAQKLKLNIAHTNAKAYTAYLKNPPYKIDWLTNKYTIDLQTGNRTSQLVYNFDHPQEVIIYFRPDESNKGGFNFHFFLSPGDDMVFNVDFAKKDNGIVVTGKGSNNNQPMLLQLKGAEIQKFYNDTVPDRIIAAINAPRAANKRVLDAYIAKYHPSAAFVKYSKYNLAYGDAQDYFSFKENNKFGIRAAYKRNQDKWEHVQDSLLLNLKLELDKEFSKTNAASMGDKASLNNASAHRVQILNNDDALIASNYTMFLRDYLLRTKEALWHEAADHPVAFYKKWYNADTTLGKKQFLDDQQNLLKEKIINKSFTGRTAEYMYALMLEEAKEESNPQNVVAIFNRFKAKYPQSKYVKWYAPEAALVMEREKQGLTPGMIFVDDSYNTLNTFRQILDITKGKTVLVDMWGTWCSPCREEISKNSATIKEYFKDKGLDYLYVANYDQHNEANWKKLIAYFHLEGMHVLANSALNKDIMSTVKGDGYPTYFIIKKDGTTELSKAGYPMDRDKLIKQLEAALAM